MAEPRRRVGPGLFVGVGAVALCCGAPGLVGVLVAGGGIAAGDAVLTAAGAVLAGLGLVLWLVTLRRARLTPPVPETARQQGPG